MWLFTERLGIPNQQAYGTRSWAVGATTWRDFPKRDPKREKDRDFREDQPFLVDASPHSLPSLPFSSHTMPG